MVPSLRILFALGAVAAIAALALAGLASFKAFSLAENQLGRTVRSYDQLALATSIEAGIGKLLIAEINSIVDPRTPPLLTAEPERIERAVDELIRTVEQEVRDGVNIHEQEQEREEFKSAYAIRALLASMRHGIDRQRALVSRLDSGAAVRKFMDNVIAVDYRHLNRIVSAVTADERREVRDRLREIAALRLSLITASAFTLAVVAAIAFVVSFVVYRMVMRPVLELGQGSQALANGFLSHRIREGGPPEFAQLARRFNDMAERLAHQQRALKQSNDALEATVEERTWQLQEKAARLAEIDRSRRLFFAKIGHELRTPLTVLIGEADVALKRQNAEADTLRQALLHITASGNYLKRRIVDLMALARSEDGKLHLTRKPVALGPMLDELLEIARGYARSNDVELEVDLQAGNINCMGDPEWLSQAVLALIDNAIKFSAPGAIVRVGLRAHEGGATITVDDCGPGVPPQDLANLFDPYFQSARGRTQSGAGLGLAVAKWVADQHGGEIEALNIAPKGLRVVLRLPQAE